jgi:hypothetical protein
MAENGITSFSVLKNASRLTRDTVGAEIIRDLLTVGKHQTDFLGRIE